MTNTQHTHSTHYILLFVNRQHTRIYEMFKAERTKKNHSHVHYTLSIYPVCFCMKKRDGKIVFMWVVSVCGEDVKI